MYVNNYLTLIVYRHYRKANGVLIIYDITNKLSFENISTWLHEIELYGDSSIEVTIVGNKLDIVNEFPEKR